VAFMGFEIMWATVNRDWDIELMDADELAGFRGS